MDRVLNSNDENKIKFDQKYTTEIQDLKIEELKLRRCIEENEQ